LRAVEFSFLVKAKGKGRPGYDQSLVAYITFEDFEAFIDNCDMAFGFELSSSLNMIEAL